jgi:hypothetical protein
MNADAVISTTANGALSEIAYGKITAKGRRPRHWDVKGVVAATRRGRRRLALEGLSA